MKGDIGVCGIRELFMQYFGNLNLKFRYSNNLQDSVFQHFGSFQTVVKNNFFAVLRCSEPPKVPLIVGSPTLLKTEVQRT